MEKWLRCALPFLAEVDFKGRKLEKSADFSNLPFHKKDRNGKQHLAAVGLQPSHSGKMHFPAATPPVKMCLERSADRDKHENKNGISAVIVRAKRRQF